VPLVRPGTSAPRSGSASTAVHALLTGPVQPATVVGAGRHAAYLRVGDDVRQLVAVVTAGAVRVPCAVVLGPGVEVPRGLVPGEDASVGAGAIGWAGGSVRITRWWASAQVRPGAAHADADADARAALADRLAERMSDHRLPDGVAEALASAVRRLARRDATAGAPLVAVLGLGQGLTPAADDAVAGLLLLAGALDPTPVLDRAAAQVATAAAVRTTAVSAALLGHAATGRAAPQVVAAVDALTGDAPGLRRERLDDAVTALLAVGHTSGADTAAGMLAAARTSRRAA
jgi:hypothetical protein